jgi:hypothetical protein
LRGLNWLRNTAATAVLNTKGSTSTAAPIFSDNSKIYKPTNDAATTDVSNHKKNFKEVGVYYANYDTNIHRRYKHVHLLFANDSDSGPSLSTATASNDLKNMVQGKLSSNTLASYDNYVKNTDSRATYDGAKLMRTTNGTNNNISFASLSNKASIRLLQDWPISSNGGSTKYFHRNKSGHKTARVKLGKCFGHYDCSGTIHNIRDTRYSFASAESGKSWRFITSLPIQNKYGQKEGTVPKLATARYGSITINIDDSLPNPPTINFIPLFKI